MCCFPPFCFKMAHDGFRISYWSALCFGMGQGRFRLFYLPHVCFSMAQGGFRTLYFPRVNRIIKPWKASHGNNNSSLLTETFPWTVSWTRMLPSKGVNICIFKNNRSTNAKNRFCTHSLHQCQCDHRHNVKIWRKRWLWRQVWTDFKHHASILSVWESVLGSKTMRIRPVLQDDLIWRYWVYPHQDRRMECAEISGNQSERVLHGFIIPTGRIYLHHIEIIIETDQFPWRLWIALRNLWMRAIQIHGTYPEWKKEQPRFDFLMLTIFSSHSCKLSYFVSDLFK